MHKKQPAWTEKQLSRYLNDLDEKNFREMDIPSRPRSRFLTVLGWLLVAALLVALLSPLIRWLTMPQDRRDAVSHDWNAGACEYMGYTYVESPMQCYTSDKDAIEIVSWSRTLHPYSLGSYSTDAPLFLFRMQNSGELYLREDFDFFRQEFCFRRTEETRALNELLDLEAPTAKKIWSKTENKDIELLFPSCPSIYFIMCVHIVGDKYYAQFDMLDGALYPLSPEGVQWLREAGYV